MPTQSNFTTNIPTPDAAVRIFEQFTETSLFDHFPNSTRRFKHFLTKEIPTSNLADHNPQSYLLPHQREAISKIDAFLGWLPANPNKLSYIEKITKNYTFYTGDLKRDGLNCCNKYELNKSTFHFDDVFFHNRHIIIQSPRGSGKTAFLNYWLTTRSQSMEVKNYTWFRFDASKVQELYTQAQIKDVKSAYVDYFRAHTIFVIAMYSGSFKGRAKSILTSDSKSALLSQIAARVTSTPNNTHFRQVIHQLSDFVESQAGHSGFYSDPSRHIVLQFLKTDSKNSRRTLLKKALSECCRAIVDLKIKVAIVFDGIDNISWTKSDPFYADSCRLFEEICTVCSNDVGSDTTIVLAARPETVSEITLPHISGHQNTSKNVNSYLRLSLGIPPIKEIVNNRLKANFNFNDNIRNEEMDIIDNSYNDYLKMICRDMLSLDNLELVDKSIRNTIKNYENETDFRFDGDILEVLFDNDIRAFIDNFTSTTVTKRRFLEAGTRGAQDANRLVEYMFLNGRPYLDSRSQLRNGSRKDYRERGTVFPNIFWYDTKLCTNNPDTWHALAGLRLLQIASKVDNFVASDLLYLLHNCFGYETRCITEIIESFVAYCLLDVVPSSENKGVFDKETIQSEFASYNNQMFITKKGRFFVEFIFCRPDILYFLALDTPMLIDVIDHRTRYVRSCRDFESLTAVDDFFQSAIITLAVFLCHLNTFHEIETKSIDADGSRRKPLERYLTSEKAMFRTLLLPRVIQRASNEFVSGTVAEDRGVKSSALRHEIASLLRRRR